MLLAGHLERYVVVYPISKRHEDEGGALINWVANLKTADGRPMPRQEWDHTSRLDEVLAAFDAFRFDFLDMPELIRGAIGEVYTYPMADRDPLPSWDFGRVTLLGDAAHPMYAMGSNGASQAIIDARVLARELAMRDSVEATVTAYDAQRRPATASVVEANRRGGPNEVLQIVHDRAPDGFARLDDVISPEELEEIATTYHRTAGFDPEILNTRPSLSVR
jgi:2-polyprenyl-6-methoxyphenol hydroxylase-like FAD-dependent oxidoreductase